MRNRVLAALSATALGVIAARTLHAGSDSSLRTVNQVDLGRYVGRWYEISRYPNRFQRKCAGDTTAFYSIRDDGKINVVNSCRKQDGSFTTTQGRARVVDANSNARLKVTFFWPFSGDYWIIGLDPEYRYAIVGEPSRKYLWILSRTPQMDGALYQTAVSEVEAAGYDASRLMKTPQSVKADAVGTADKR